MSLLSSLLGLMGCSKKKQEDAWAVATGHDGGKPLIFRFREVVPPDISKPEFPNLLAISWQYDPDINNGMPTPKDNERMVLLEDLLEKALEGKKQSILTAVVTGNGVKEWQWYSRDAKTSMQIINEALSGHSEFPIQISTEHDPEWSAYLNLRGMAKP